jgi:hypothetical protein
MITKLISVFRSRPDNLYFDLDNNAGDYYNETKINIKYVLL